MKIKKKDKPKSRKKWGPLIACLFFVMVVIYLYAFLVNGGGSLFIK
tara:strand:- start:974 stop:1111 length:138 start_codon:yes stop_codon:yes gene_type:complete